MIRKGLGLEWALWKPRNIAHSNFCFFMKLLTGNLKREERILNWVYILYFFLDCSRVFFVYRSALKVSLTSKEDLPKCLSPDFRRHMRETSNHDSWFVYWLVVETYKQLGKPHKIFFTHKTFFWQFLRSNVRSFPAAQKKTTVKCYPSNKALIKQALELLKFNFRPLPQSTVK